MEPNHHTHPQVTVGELFDTQGFLIKQFEEAIHVFENTIDEHFKKKDPLFEQLENGLREHKERLDQFGAGLEPRLARIDEEIDASMSACKGMLRNIETSKHQLVEAITHVSDSLRADSQLNLVEKASVVDDLGDAVNSVARVVTEWSTTAKACQEVLYTRLQKHEDFLHSDEKLMASFTILLKMRDEIAHGRLERHEAFLKSTEDLLKSCAELLANYQQLVQSSSTPGEPD